MPQVTLSLSTLGLLNNGSAEAVVNAALSAAVLDTEDRGAGPRGDRKERQVNITVTFIGRADGNVEIGLQAGVKMPKYRVADTVADVRMRDGKPFLLFRDDAAHDPRQGTVGDYLPRDPSEVPNE